MNESQAKRITDSVKEKLGLTKTNEPRKDTTALGHYQTIYSYLKKSRLKAEYEMWINDQFYQGEQYTYYNPVSKAVERYAGKDADKVVINKIKQNARFVIMWLNRDHPQSRVMPGNQDDQAYDKAKKTEHLLDYWYDVLELSTTNKQTTLDAYKYKIGAQKIIWDQAAMAATSPYGDQKSTKTNGEISIKRVDPYDLLIDPMLASVNIDDARFVCHSMPRSLGELRNNPNYKNKDKLSADGKLADSFLKESAIRAQTSGGAAFTPQGADDLATTLVHELYLREIITEGDNQGAWQIRKAVFTDNGVLLQDVVWPLPYYPFEIYAAEVQGNLLDGGGPVRDLRSPQRAFNQINSIIHENAQIMGKINWRMPRGANVNVITDEVGQFLEYDPTPGGIPEQTTPSSLPAYMPLHRDALEKYLDDLGGNHSASYGRSPGSKASGELVNRLQEGDSNNLLLMRDNLDDFQRRVYKKALKTFKEYGVADRMVRSKAVNVTGRYDFWTIKPADVVVDGDIEVVTGSKMPYSMADRQEMLLNMKKEGVIDGKTVLKAINLPDLDNAMNTAQLDIERALNENRMMLDGKQIQVPAKGEDHQAHIEVHTQLIKSQDYYDASTEVKDTIQSHYSAHINASYQLAMIASSLNVEPIKRNETVMFRQDLAQMTPIERTQAMAKIAIQSDAAAIQSRGGLNVQDPAMAEQQAQKEDLEMMNGTPVQISLGDNHQVHVETHTQIMESAAWPKVPEVIKTVLTEHVKEHMNAMKALAPAPGLVGGKDFDVPNAPQVVQPTNQAAMDPENPTPRPLQTHELIQPKGAVDNQLATEKHVAAQEAKAKAAAEKENNQPKPATKPKKKATTT